METRYAVTRVPGTGSWGIVDRHARALCTLAGEALTWPVRDGAAGWLYACRVAWGNGLTDAPAGWNGK